MKKLRIRLQSREKDDGSVKDLGEVRLTRVPSVSEGILVSLTEKAHVLTVDHVPLSDLPDEIAAVVTVDVYSVED